MQKLAFWPTPAKARRACAFTRPTRMTPKARARLSTKVSASFVAPALMTFCIKVILTLPEDPYSIAELQATYESITPIREGGWANEAWTSETAFILKEKAKTNREKPEGKPTSRVERSAHYRNILATFAAVGLMAVDVGSTTGAWIDGAIMQDTFICASDLACLAISVIFCMSSALAFRIPFVRRDMEYASYVISTAAILPKCLSVLWWKSGLYSESYFETHRDNVSQTVGLHLDHEHPSDPNDSVISHLAVVYAELHLEGSVQSTVVLIIVLFDVWTTTRFFIASWLLILNVLIGTMPVLYGAFQLPETFFTNVQEALILPAVGVDLDFDPLELERLHGDGRSSVLLATNTPLLSSLASEWGCDESVLRGFLLHIDGLYQKQPYHNFKHGALVAHTMSVLCRSLDISKRSILFNDASVLENFHCSLTFRVLNDSSCNLFALLSDAELVCTVLLFAMLAQEAREVRSKIIELILATDMRTHFEFLNRFRTIRGSEQFNFKKNEDDRWYAISDETRLHTFVKLLGEPAVFVSIRQENSAIDRADVRISVTPMRRLAAELCMRASDIGHGALKWKQHFEWTARATTEFYLQGDEESRLGRTMSPLCDRETHAQLATSQLGFLRHVVRPLFVELDAIEKQKTMQVA
ncbi:hypothetical protein cyc_07785 [Cyclospora cayetanensis]|uniref:PDEase domain-containing protein n=1 Tax=Cyclospora cayetanensis TaxID=88456 RepID=A0A1D3D8E6_9EIME|nr:hypothetical protein cyc_07785 [Cyclospora cayetanensis]